MKFNCSELQENDAVVFPVEEDGREKLYDGNVLGVDTERQLVGVVYLDGYKSRSTFIPFNKMIAKGDEDGEMMTFGGYIRGFSVLLDPR